MTWESNQTLNTMSLTKPHISQKVVRSELWAKLENVVLICIKKRANQFSKRTMLNSSGQQTGPRKFFLSGIWSKRPEIDVSAETAVSAGALQWQCAWPGLGQTEETLKDWGGRREMGTEGRRVLRQTRHLRCCLIAPYTPQPSGLVHTQAHWLHSSVVSRVFTQPYILPISHILDWLGCVFCFLSLLVLLCFCFFFPQPDTLRPGLFPFRCIHQSALCNVSVPEIQLETSQAWTF